MNGSQLVKLYNMAFSFALNQPCSATNAAAHVVDVEAPMEFRSIRDVTWIVYEWTPLPTDVRQRAMPEHEGTCGGAAAALGDIAVRGKVGHDVAAEGNQPVIRGGHRERPVGR